MRRAPLLHFLSLSTVARSASLLPPRHHHFQQPAAYAAAAAAGRPLPLGFVVTALSFSSLGRVVSAVAKQDEPAVAATATGKSQSPARRLFSSLTARFASSSSSSSSSSSASAMEPSSSSSSGAAWRDRITLLTQREAQAIDEELMSTPGFSVDQLMELAGLSVAQAVDDFLQHKDKHNKPGRSAVLLVCGPGNNGGDGLVAARHLHHFGYDTTVVYPKRPAKQLYENLVKQCEDLGIEVTHALPEAVDATFDCVVDAMFGFGSSGPLRAPFDSILASLASLRASPVLSVDVPSGWDVEKGDVYATGFHPKALVSLTAPKRCAAFFRGRHYLGGRFVPPKIRSQYRLDLPAYPGTSQFVEVPGWGTAGGGGGDVDAAGGAPEFVVVWVTAPSKEEAGKLAEGLVGEKLAACVNLVPGVESVYTWEGKLERGEEVLMMAKTRRSLLAEFAAYVKAHHSYEVPETIAAGILGGSGAYLSWLRESTREAAAAKKEG